MEAKTFATAIVLTLLLFGCEDKNNTPVDVNNKQSAGTSSLPQQVSPNTETNFSTEKVLEKYGLTPLSVLDISEQEIQGRNNLVITLSVPINPTINHQEYFNVSSHNTGIVDGSWVVSPSGKTLKFSATDPDTTYKVTVYQGLVAGNNQPLATTISKTLKTRSLKPSVNFNTNGAFLTAGLSHGIPVVSVNVPAVDINFYRVENKNVPRFLEEISDGYYRWNVNRIIDYSSLAYSGRYELDIAKNTRTTLAIDVESIDALKNQGIYLAVMTVAGSYDNKQVMWFSVTDIGLHARFYQQQLDVYASSLKTGKAISKTKISLLGRKGELLQQGLTSPTGQVSFDANLDKAQLIIAEHNQHFSLIEVNTPALDLSDFDLGHKLSKPQTLFIYSPRDLYRPSEFINFNALLRDDDGNLSNRSILNAAIRSPDGTRIKVFKWHGNQQGYYFHQWQIPASAQVGQWQLEVEMLNKEVKNYYFQVEEFLPERLKLTFTSPDKKHPITVDKASVITIPVLGEYLYGAPATNNRLSTNVSIKPWRSPVKNLPKYVFGDSRQTVFNQQQQLDDINLDKNGEGRINYKGDWTNQQQNVQTPLKVNFVSSLYESGGRPVTRSYSALVWPSKYMLGIRADFEDKNPPENSTVSFDLVKASLDGKKQSAENIKVSLIRENRRYFWVYSEDEGWHYEWSDKEFVERTITINLSDTKTNKVNFPVAWGNYRIEVRDVSNGLLTTLPFYVGNNWYERWQDSQEGSGAARPDKITMALDKANYNAGDIIKVSIIPPKAGQGLIIVEGDKPLWLKRQYIPSEGLTVEIPVQENWRQHNIYISTIVLQPAIDLDTAKDVKFITPKRSFGLIHLPLARESRKLDIEFDVVEQILPNTTLPVTLKIKSNAKHNNGEQRVFVTLAAVDVGVLNISNFDTPDPFDAFFGQRRYNVDVRDVYAKVIELSHEKRGHLRFGGDSDAELTRGGSAPQSDVQILSLFSGLVTVNKNNAGESEVTIPLSLPDFNGKVRLMALAFSDNEFGSAEQNVTIAAPIVAQISLPRFLAYGDTSTIALDLTNLSGEKQTLSVALQSNELVTLKSNNINDNDNDKEKTTTVTLVEGEKITLRYQVHAKAMTGQATFSLKVKATGKLSSSSKFTLADLTINKQWQLGLRPAYPALFKQKQKLLQAHQSFSVDENFAKNLVPATVKANIAISPRANINLQQQLTHLIQYPYGCLEQTSSRVFPLIFATPAKQQLFNLQKVDEHKRLEMINKGIERLASLQLNSGGFGLWSNTSEEEHWLTAYVADFLINARDMGVNVPTEMLSNTLKRLQRYVARSGRFYNEKYSEDSKHANFTYKAYAAYVLSQVNQVPLATLRSLAKRQSADAKSGLSQLHLAIALHKMGDKKLSRYLLEKSLNNLPKARTVYLADYGSQVRDLAMMIHLMLKHNIATDKAISLSFTLAKQLYARQWLSTQERNALFLAGMSLQQYDQATWSADIIIGKATEESGNNRVARTQHIEQSKAYNQPLTVDELLKTVTIKSQHQQPLLVNVNMVGYSKKPPKESTNGLSIRRRWLDLKGRALTYNKVNVGDLFVVHLEINAEQNTPDALVTDLLPAGFELENQNLDHAIKLDTFSIAGKSVEQWQDYADIKHQEYRDDRYVAAVSLEKHQSTHLFYLVRAVTPGRYQMPASLVEDMYRAELRGVSATTIFDEAKAQRESNGNRIVISQ